MHAYESRERTIQTFSGEIRAPSCNNTSRLTTHCTNVERFLDTNVLVYAHGGSAPDTRDAAQRLIVEGLRQEDTAVSAQVLSEFYVTVTVRNPFA